MRKLLALALLSVWLALPAVAQNRRSIDRLEATDEFRPPVKTSCSALTNQRRGDMCFDSDDNIMYKYNGTAWVPVGQEFSACTGSPPTDACSQSKLCVDTTTRKIYGCIFGVDWLELSPSGGSGGGGTADLGDVTGTLAVVNGGTGGTTAAEARTNLSAAASGNNADITAILGLTTPLSIPQGGTNNAALGDDAVFVGDAATAATARTLPNCPTGNQLLYTQATNTFSCEADGASGSGTYNVVKEEGSALGTTGSGTTLDFVGQAITASGTGTTKTITLSQFPTGSTSVVGTGYTFTAGSGIATIGDMSATRTIATASEESGFLKDGNTSDLACFSIPGAMQVMDNGVLEWCDGATTTLRRAAFADLNGQALIALSSPYSGLSGLDDDIDAFDALNGSPGIVVRTPTAAAVRTLTAGSSKVAVTNGSGVGGNPTVDVTEANLNLANIGGTFTSADVSSFNNGTSASTTTFWRGDGTWSVPPGSGGLTVKEVDGSPSVSATTLEVQSTTNTDGLTVTDQGSGIARLALGQIGVSHFNNGTSASGTTFLRGDGTWATPSGSGDATIQDSPADNLIPRSAGTTTKALDYPTSNRPSISDAGLISAPGGFSGTLSGNATTATDATNATNATNLIGSGSTSNAVDLSSNETNGTLPVAKGGTGGTDQATARLNLLAATGDVSGNATGVACTDCIALGTETANAYVATATGGAGITVSGVGSETATLAITTASSEADFLASGALTCGAATQGKMQIHTTPLQYCDNATTPTLQYAAYGDSAGAAKTGDSASSFFASGALETTIGGTGKSTAWTAGRVPYVASASALADDSGFTFDSATDELTVLGGLTTTCTPASNDCTDTFTDNSGEATAPVSGTMLYAVSGELYKKDPGDATDERLMLNSGNVSGDVTCTSGGVCTVASSALGLTDIQDDAGCTGGQLVRRNAGDTAYECVAAVGTGTITAVGPVFASGDAFVNGADTGGNTVGLIWEGDTVNANDYSIVFPADPSSNFTYTLPPSGGTGATLDGTETLTNKTLTTPSIFDSGAAKKYNFAVSNLAADRTVTLPLLTSGDTFVFESHAQTLTSKTLASPVVTTQLTIPRATSFPGSPVAGSTVIITDDCGAGVCDSGTSCSNTGTATSFCQYNGSGWVAIGDANNGTDTVSFVLNTPTSGDDGDAQTQFPRAATITRISCSTDVGTATININKRTESTPNTTGTDALSAGLVCDTNSQTSCTSGCDVNTISSAAVTARQLLALEVDSVASAPTYVRVHVEYTTP